MTAPTQTVTPENAREIDRRRTFAIISHPDAGKTTLTEKLLLYGGAIHLAGSVTARKNQNSTASDWMDMEKERGISVSSTVHPVSSLLHNMAALLFTKFPLRKRSTGRRAGTGSAI